MTSQLGLLAEFRNKTRQNWRAKGFGVAILDCTVEQIRAYAAAADAAGLDYVEVGHGNGLGASSLQLGESLVPERTMLETARSVLKHAKLSVHVMPGFATIDREIRQGIDCGVDLFRVGSHCTEADITQRHINFVRANNREVWGVLMMTHMVTPAVLVEEASKMQSYGAEGVMLMDSAGAYIPEDVRAKIGLLVEKLHIPVGFHAHMNLGLGIANSLAAVQAGARILDGTGRGFGAGAGNAPIELVVAAITQAGFKTKVDLYKILDLGELAAKLFAANLPSSNAVTIVSGLAGVFSGFAKPVLRIAKDMNVDPRDVFFALGRRKVVGGQEDLILETAQELARAKQTAPVQS